MAIHPSPITSNQGTLKVYTLGFLLSLLLTGAAYLVIAQHMFAGWIAVVLVSLLALVQLVVQLVFFLHIDSERGPRWNLAALIFAAIVVSILAGGSLWIMKNLNDNGMSAADLTKYIQDQEAIHK
jgi:cytochrome o ubiquinol oxidase operon protein cyoD